MRRRLIVEERGFWSGSILVALSLVLLAQLVRAYVPLAFQLGEEIGGTRGYISAGVIALAVFASPALAAVGRLPGGGRTGLVASVVGLGAARLAIQFVHPIPVWLGTLAVAAGLFAVPVVVGSVRRVADDGALLLGVYLGLALDSAIRAGALSWDIAWQDAAPAGLVSIGMVALAVAATVAVTSNGGVRATPPALRIAAFGPFLALQILFLQNPAALASQAGLSLPVAAGVVLLIDAGVLIVANLRPRVGPLVAAGLMALAGVGGYLLVIVSGPSAVFLFGAEQVVLALLLGQGVDPGADRTSTTSPSGVVVRPRFRCLRRRGVCVPGGDRGAPAVFEGVRPSRRRGRRGAVGRSQARHDRVRCPCPGRGRAAGVGLRAGARGPRRPGDRDLHR